MHLILSDADLQRMSPELRRSLLEYVGVAGHAPSAETDPVPLDRKHAIMLLRETSFHRDGKILNVLLKRLTHGAAAPTRKILERALPGTARRSLGRHLSTLNRVATRVTKRPNAKLWRYQPAEDVYAVHPATRTALRELIPVLARSGRSEEPLWE